MQKKFNIMYLLVVFALFYFAFGVDVYASDQDQTVALMKTKEETVIRAENNENSEIVVTLSEDTPVIANEETENGWFRVAYQDYEGYINRQQLTEYTDNQKLTEEFSNVEQYFNNGFDKINELYKSKVQDYMWIIAITVLIVASVVVRIVTIIKKNKGMSEENAR